MVSAGKEGRAPIMLLHGFAGSHTTWRSVAPILAETRHVLTPDLPGHGGSRGWPDLGTAPTAARAVRAELAARGLDRVHLVGHSLGGAVAALVALREPDRIASLTLLSPGGFGTEINGRLLKRYAAARDAETLRSLIEQFVGYKNPVPEALIEDLVADRADPARAEGFPVLAAEIFKGDEQGTLPRRDIGALPCPVKVVWGTQDRILPTRQAHHLPGPIAVHVFEDVGHMLPLEIPEAVARLILENAAGE